MADSALLPTAQLIDLLEEYGDRVLETAEGQAMANATDALEAEAVALAPVQTGELEGSSRTRVFTRGSKIVGSVSFGAPHASRAHELPPQARGPRTRRKPPTRLGEPGPKYLERPLRAFTKELGEFIADPVRKTLSTLRLPKRGRRRG